MITITPLYVLKNDTTVSVDVNKPISLRCTSYSNTALIYYYRVYAEDVSLSDYHRRVSDNH